MKTPARTLIATVTSAMLVLATPATWADDHHERGGYHGGYHGGPPHGRGYGPPPYRPGWGPPGYHWRGYYAEPYPYYYGHHHHDHDDHDDEVAYLVGGLLLGGLVTHAYERSRAYAPAPSSYGPSYVAPDSSRRLVRDAAGNCYESYFDAAGNEIRTPTSPSQCNW